MDTDKHGSKKLNAESQRTRRNAERKSFATLCVLCASAFFPIRVYLCSSVVKTLLDSGFRLLYARPMFELIAPQLTTAAEKLTHLRRFL